MAVFYGTSPTPSSFLIPSPLLQWAWRGDGDVYILFRTEFSTVTVSWPFGQIWASTCEIWAFWKRNLLVLGFQWHWFMVVWQHVHLGQQWCSKLSLWASVLPSNRLWSDYNTRFVFLPVEQASNPITKWLVIPTTNLATVAAGGIACLAPSIVAHRSTGG